MILTKKACSGCGKLLGYPSFYTDKSKRDGCSSRCKKCVRAAQLLYNEAHRDEANERAKRHYQQNREAKIKYSKEWKQANAQRVRETTNRRARETRLSLAGDARRDVVRNRRAQRLKAWVENVANDVVWERDRGICRLCNTPADPKNWHLEHLTPLSRGGAHSYENTAVSHPWCNQSKGVKTFSEWMEIMG